MSPEDFDAYFDRFIRSAFRLETLQDYYSPDAVAAYLRGLPRPERSVVTSPWLARIAVTAVAGKRWERVRVVEEPLTDYTQYELAGYVESQAAGEQIRIARRGVSPSLDGLREDFWLFEGGTPYSFALLMEYDSQGRFVDAEFTMDPATMARCERERAIAMAWSVPLNEYLAERTRRAA